MSGRRRNGRNGRNGYNGNGTVFNAGTLVNILAIVLSFAATMGGFYFLTNYRLNQNSDEIKAEVSQRKETSAEFFKQMTSLNDSLSKLNTNVAVQASVLESIKTTLAQRR